MSVTEVSGGLKSDLHRLLESLNVLDNDLELEGPMNPNAKDFVPVINIKVKLIVEDTKEVIDEFLVSAQMTKSLCDILRGKEKYENWKYVEMGHEGGLSGGYAWGESRTLPLYHRTYYQNREIVEDWKNSFFKKQIYVGAYVILHLYERPPGRPNATITTDLGIALESAPMWNRMPPDQHRRIHIMVTAYSFTSLYDTKEVIGQWQTDIQFGDSLCTKLDTETNWKHYVMIKAECSGAETLDLDVTGRPYSETKTLIDRWARSLFGIQNVGIPQIPQIRVYMRVHHA